ncbi:antibiotic biosynthesis monooxygenase [Spirochaeta dissipatitropha]
MPVTIVHIRVKNEYLQDFITASRENQKYSVQENGNLRFDFLQSSDDNCSFVLYEAYESPEAAAAHKQTDHYLKWRETVAPMMTEARKGLPYDILAI